MKPHGWLISRSSDTGDDLEPTGSRDRGKLVMGGDNDHSKPDTPEVPSGPLRLALPSDEARGQYLSATRRETYDALALFHAHVKNSVSLMFGIMTAVMAVVGIVLQRNAPSKLINAYCITRQ